MLKFRFILLLAFLGDIMAEALGTLSKDTVGGIQCLFSDIDGTLVHYYESETEAPGPPEVIPLPASSTGRMAHISIETLKLAARIRSTGARLVLVSGTRYSTFVDRLPYLPRADAYVIENGGRIFYPREQPPESTGPGEVEAGGRLPAEFSFLIGDPELTAHPASALSEDLKWREGLEGVTGPATEDAKSPEERKGPLWDLCRRAVADGFEVDTKAYCTMFRIKIKDGCKEGQSRGGSEGEEDADRAAGEGRDGGEGGEGATKRLLKSLPPGLRVVTNFGLVDICPERSGKHNAAAYLAREHFGISLDRCASMGDDDNDVALANIMGKGAFITACTSKSVEAAAKSNPERFKVSKEEGVLSSEEMLKLILALCS